MLLAIETSTRIGSVALFDGDRVVAHRVLDQTAKHGALLGPAIASIAELSFEKLEAYAISIGPGSFTGLRIGLGFLKGIAFAHPRPAIAVSSLEVIAAQILAAHPEAQLALPLLDARRGEVYAGLFRGDAGAILNDARLPEGAYAIGDLLPRLETSSSAGSAAIFAGGDGVLLDLGATPPWSRAAEPAWTPDALTLGRIALRRFAAGDGVDVLGLEPVYHQLAPAEFLLAP